MKPATTLVLLLTSFSCLAQVEIFKDANFAGASERLITHGHFPYSTFGEVGNDAISSVKVAPGHMAILFEDVTDNKPSGKYIIIKGNVPDLGDYHGNWNDKTSYVFEWLAPENSILMYKDSYFKGQLSGLGIGTHYSAAAFGGISSLYVPEGYTATLSVEDPDLRADHGSASETFESGVHLYVGDRINDKAQYIKVSQVEQSHLQSYNWTNNTGGNSNKNVISIRECTSDTDWDGACVNIQKENTVNEIVKIKGKITRFSASVKALNPQYIPTSGEVKIYFEIIEIPSNNVILRSSKQFFLPQGKDWEGWVSFEFDPVYTNANGVKLVMYDERNIFCWKYIENKTTIGVYSFHENPDANKDFIFCVDYEPYRGSWVPNWYKEKGYGSLDE